MSYLIMKVDTFDDNFSGPEFAVVDLSDGEFIKFIHWATEIARKIKNEYTPTPFKITWISSWPEWGPGFYTDEGFTLDSFDFSEDLDKRKFTVIEALPQILRDEIDGNDAWITEAVQLYIYPDYLGDFQYKGYIDETQIEFSTHDIGVDLVKTLTPFPGQLKEEFHALDA